jgi:polyisoprenyl-phosphate glycosyltransferase
MKTFSIVIPVYQNEKNIDDTVGLLSQLQKNLKDYQLELVFVNDGSTDNSQELLLKHQAKHPDMISLIELTRNFGQTPAIQAGLQYASGHCVGIISCDLQEPFEKFIDMIQAWEGGAKFVVGERIERQESHFHQRVSNIYWKVVKKYALKDFPTQGYDFCLLDRSVVGEINRIDERNTSIFPLLWWLGYDAERILIIRQVRRKGTSQWKWWMKFKLTVDTIIGFTHIPARLVSGAGVVGSLFFVLFTIFMLIQWYILQAAPQGWMTVVLMLGLVGSSILFSIGLVIEYLVRILDESRGRPNYIIERVHRKKK